MATKRITALLIDAFADWEPALLTAAARTFFDADIAHITPGAREVVSAGGMRVRPQGDVAGLDPRDYDALVVIGSSQWTSVGRRTSRRSCVPRCRPAESSG